MGLSRKQVEAVGAASPDLRRAARVLTEIVNREDVPSILREMLRGPVTSIRLQADVWTALAERAED